MTLEQHILKLASQGLRHGEIAQELRRINFHVSSLSSVEKEIKVMILKYRCKTFAQLMFLYGKANP